MILKETLSLRAREVLLDGKWIANTNFKEQITTVSWEDAVEKIGNLNTIAALTFHIGYYLKGLNWAWEHGTLEIRDRYSFDVPPIRNKDDWKRLVMEFLENAEIFTNHILKMPEAQLETPFTDVKYGSYLRNIEGMIEHCYYHLGQIVLLRKFVEENRKHHPKW